MFTRVGMYRSMLTSMVAGKISVMTLRRDIITVAKHMRKTTTPTSSASQRSRELPTGNRACCATLAADTGYSTTKGPEQTDSTPPTRQTGSRSLRSDVNTSGATEIDSIMQLG